MSNNDDLRHDRRKCAMCLKDWTPREAGPPRSRRKILVEVFRGLVRQQVEAFRHNEFTREGHFGVLECAIKRDLIEIHESHVDHAQPYTFENLLNEFMERAGVTFESMRLDLRPESRRYEIEPWIALAWRMFHFMHARLRVTCETCNLSQRRIRETPVWSVCGVLEKRIHMNAPNAHFRNDQTEAM